MASTYSTNLKIELMGTGENSGTWGTITNTNLGTAFEQAVIGLGNPDYTSDANLTITLTNTNASQAARCLVLNVTSVFGALTATRELIVPTIQKQYIVQNNTTGGQSITVKTSAGTGITVPNGRKAHLYVDGTNVIQMFDFVDINGGAIDGTAIGATSASTGAFTSLTASGATTLNGAVALGDASGDLITVPGTVNSNLLFTDATYDIGASGATRPRDMFLSRNLTVGGTLTLAGGVNLNGNVTVGDASTDTLTINSTITSNLIFTDNTYDIGASGATRPRNLFLAGNATIGGAQTLTGALTVDSTTDTSSATTGSIQTDGGVGIAKGLYVGGNTTLGDAAADSVTVNGTITSNLIFTDNTYDIGASGATRPRNLYLAGLLTMGGALTVNGNATLGDATTDTVTVNGYMGIGVAGGSSRSLNLGSTALTGTTQFGVVSGITSTSSATTATVGFYSGVSTAASAYTSADVRGFWADNAVKGAGSTITNQHGVYVGDQTQGTNNYGITSLVSSGTNKFNIYASGTAQNFFAGNVGFGNQAPTNPITVAGTGNATYSSAKGLVVDHVGSSTSVIVPIGFSWASSISTQNPYWGMGFIPIDYAGGTGELGFYVGAVEKGRFTSGGLAVTGTGSYSGSLTVGTTTALYLSRLTVAYNPTSANGPFIVDNRSFGINRGGAQWFGGQYNTAGDYRPWSGIVGAKENATDGNSAGFLAFYVNKNAADAVEAARITSTNTFLLGTTTDYGGMLTVIPRNGNPVTASSTLNQIQIGEASENSAYRLNLGYTLVSGAYKGNIQAIAGGAGSTLVLNADGGFVGIGTNTPGYVLDVQSSNAAAVNTIARFYNGFATGNTDIYVNNVGTGGDLLLTRRANGDFWVYQSGAFPIRFYTQAAQRFSVDASGRVGFGTSGTSSDRFVDMAFSGAVTTGATQFGFVFNPTYPTTPTTNLYNLYSGPNLTAGTTVTNVYGHYLEAIGATGSTVTNRWGVYQAGSSDNNYFAGKVLVGTTSTSGGYPLRAKGGGVDGSVTVSVASGVTTTIYTVPNISTACMCVVFGDNGTNGFCDLLFFLGNTTPQVVSSKTMYGSPPARTYSVASNTQLQINVAMDSSTRTAVLGTIT